MVGYFCSRHTLTLAHGSVGLAHLAGAVGLVLVPGQEYEAADLMNSDSQQGDGF